MGYCFATAGFGDLAIILTTFVGCGVKRFSETKSWRERAQRGRVGLAAGGNAIVAEAGASLFRWPPLLKVCFVYKFDADGLTFSGWQNTATK